MTRAAVGLARPSTSSGLAPRATSSAGFSRRMTAPKCKPARAFSGLGSEASAWWYSSAYCTASVAVSNSSSMPSVLSISRPRHCGSRSRATRSCAGPDLGHGLVADRLGQLGAVHHVGQQECAKISHPVQGESVRIRSGANPQGPPAPGRRFAPGPPAPGHARPVKLQQDPRAPVNRQCYAAFRTPCFHPLWKGMAGIVTRLRCHLAEGAIPPTCGVSASLRANHNALDGRFAKVWLLIQGVAGNYPFDSVAWLVGAVSSPQPLERTCSRPDCRSRFGAAHLR